MGMLEKKFKSSNEKLFAKFIDMMAYLVEEFQ